MEDSTINGAEQQLASTSTDTTAHLEFDNAGVDSSPPLCPGSDTTTSKSAPASVAHLDDEHIQYLHERACPPDHPAMEDFASIDGSDIQVLCGLVKTPECRGLAMYYPGIDYVRVRADANDDGERLYFAVRGKAVPIYLVRGVNYAAAKTIIVAESLVKALAVSAHVGPAIGLGGVSTTLAGDELNESWRQLGVKGRDFTLLFDTNRASNPAVMHAEARLARALTAAGAHVRLARLNLVVDDGNAGPDDVIAEHGPDLVRLAIEDAVESEPILRARTENLEELVEDGSFLAAVNLLSSKERNKVAAAWGERKEPKLGVKALKDALKEHKSARRESAGHVLLPQYAVIEGRLCVVEAEKPARVILDGVLRIVETLRSESGETCFVVEGTSQSGKAIGCAVVTSKALETVEWVGRLFGASVTVHGRTNELRSALTSMAEDNQVLTFKRTGFVETEQGLAYVHAGGHVGASGLAIRTELEDELAKYELPSNATRAMEAFRWALQLFTVIPAQLAFLLLSCVTSALLSHFNLPRFCVVLVGRSGVFKTTLAHLVVSFFGTEFDPKRGTIDMSSTAAAITERLYRAKDVVTVIDDFAPGNNARQAEKYREVVEQVIRAIGNGSNRSRMTSDMDARPDHPPRGLSILTAEESPGATESIQSRCVMVRLSKEVVDVPALTAFQQQLRLLPYVSRFIVEQLIQNHGGVMAVFRRAEAEAAERLRTVAAIHRAAHAVAHLRGAFAVLLDGAVVSRAITAAQATEFGATADDVLGALLLEQETARAEADATENFMEAFYAAWGAGRIKIVSVDEPETEAHGYFDKFNARVVSVHGSS